MAITILEPEAKIPVFDEADVLVVGGGPAGSSAAISAARNGAKVVLLERYGFLGGLVTGGQVTMIPNLDNGTGVKVLGIQQEWMDRLAQYPDAVFGPKQQEAGSQNAALLDKWSRYFGNVWNGKVIYTTFIDPEMMKVVLTDMVSEANVNVYYHCWAAKAYMEDGALKGVFFESKEGRKAVLAKVIIDATGEGDIFASAGAAFDIDVDPTIRNSNMTECFRIAGCDYAKYAAYRAAFPEEYAEKMAGLNETVGFRMMPIPANRNDNVWVNNWITGRDSMSVKDLTAVEQQVKHAIPIAIDYLRHQLPGFEGCYLMDIASIVGARHSRRIKGEYKITMEDLKSGKTYADTIAMTPAMHSFNNPGAEIPMSIPYRALVPEALENLIAAGRCLSADVQAHNWLNLIPHSVATGEAAGAAAALAVHSGVTPRKVDIGKLQVTLKNQGVYLE